MAQSGDFLGYDILPNVNEAEIERDLRIRKPRTAAILNNSGYALYLKRNVAPDTMIYLRNYDPDGDENDLFKYSPVEYFDKYGLLTTGGILGLQIGNEPGNFSEATLERANLFLKEALKRGIPAGAASWSVGTTPNSVAGWDTPAGREFAELICTHPHTLSAIFNEYFCIEPSSGMIVDGTVDAAWFATHLYGDNLPTLEQVLQFNHVGRGGYFIQFCRSIRKVGWFDPVVDDGEFGLDAIGDGALDGYLKSQPFDKSAFAFHLRGWKTYAPFWKQRYPNQTPQQIYARMLRTTANRYLIPLGYRSARIYAAGNSNTNPNEQVRNWKDFRVDDDNAMLTEIERTAVVVTPPAPPPVALPPVGRSVFEREPGKFSNLRSTPAVDIDNDIGDVYHGDEIEYLDQTEPTAQYTWIHIKHIKSDKIGWLALQDGMRFTPKPVAPPAPPPPAPIIPLFTRAELEALAQHHEAMAAILRTAAGRAA
jgi:hypothetical protein